MHNENLSQETNRQPMLQAMSRPARVLCQRTGGEIPREEHLRCPFCTGKLDDIANGQHQRFCDFRPARDPLRFVFTPDSARES
jgi:hypothetical protein